MTISAYVISKAQNLARQPADIARAPWCLYVEHADSVLRDRLANFATQAQAVTYGRLLGGWRVPVRVERHA